jgi:mannose-6-phosphate isomerase-like protein (cupin superfamily)
VVTAVTAAPKLVVRDIDEETATLAPGLPSRTIGEANESCLKLSVYQGDGNWHAHTSTAEIFVVLDGEMFLDVYQGETVSVRPRQAVTVPAGIVHRPRAMVRTTILCFKPLVSETEFYEEVVSESNANA